MVSLLIAALLAVPLAACGSGDDDEARETIATAAANTVNKGSARIEMTGSIEGPGLPGAIPIKASGVIDNKERKGRLELDFTGLADALPGGAGVDASDLNGEFIIDGLVIYMRFPFLTQLPGIDKEWLKVDAEKLGEQQGLDLGQLSQLGQTDPSQSLQYLRAVSGDVEELGGEEVRGVDTTHYKADVELKKVPDALPEAQREQFRKGIDALVEQLGTDEIPIEVWIDDEGLVRRERVDFSFEEEGSGGEASVRIDVELFDFGVAVDVSPPPDDQVQDLAELAAGAAP
jgi:hypothetical protein